VAAFTAFGRRLVVPGHDPLVTQRYPALNGDTRGIVHRVDLARLDAWFEISTTPTSTELSRC
jgi:hypothetical protein